MSDSRMFDSVFRRQYFRLPSGEIGYLRFLLEGYDGLAFLRTLDGREALVEISYAPSRQSEVAKLLTALQVEISLTEVPPPSETSP